MFKVTKFKKGIKATRVFVGLPGIANVGKIAIDFMVESLKAEKVLEIESDSFPNSVFVNPENLIDMPKVVLYSHKDLLFLTGDVQPLNERDCYAFCEFLLDILEETKCSEIITLGGIGLPRIPKKVKVYVTGNDPKFVKEYSKDASNDIFGVVGPIIGVTGLLIGLSMKRKIKGASLLAQTYGHPSYLGIKGSRELLDVVNKKFKLKLNLNNLDKEINELEKVSEEDTKVEKVKEEFTPGREMRYIG